LTDTAEYGILGGIEYSPVCEVRSLAGLDERSTVNREEAIMWVAAAVRFERFMESLHAARDWRAEEGVQLAVVGGHHQSGGEDRAA
jgi:hypothetical protein